MMQHSVDAIHTFTRRFCDSWQQQTGHLPVSIGLADIDSPCVQQRAEHGVYWLPQPFTLPAHLGAVERGVEIALQPSVVAWYTAQFAADMAVSFRGQPITLLQVWNEDDFQRVQENLIGHLVMKRRLKQMPTLFIGATDHDTEIISICNLSGEVIREALGSKKRDILSENLAEFLGECEVTIVK